MDSQYKLVSFREDLYSLYAIKLKKIQYLFLKKKRPQGPHAAVKLLFVDYRNIDGKCNGLLHSTVKHLN